MYHGGGPVTFGEMVRGAVRSVMTRRVSEGRSGARVAVHGPRIMISFIFMLSVAFAFTAPVSAQVDRASCGHFDTQEDAQTALDENPELVTTLDSDGDGIACEELQAGGPVVIDPVSCGFFETREDAQTALDEDPELATTLDNDGNGIACETLPKGTGGETSTTGGETTTSGTSGRAIALPNTGAGAAERDRTFPWTMPVTALVLTFGGVLIARSRPISDPRI